MNILLLGATGRVGKVVTGIIIGNGHQLTVLVRDKNKVKLQSEYLDVVEGDIYDWAILKKLSTRGYDVIINVIGAHPLKPSTLATDAAIAISSLFVFIEKPIRYIGITGLAQMQKTIFGRLYIWLSKLTPLKHHVKDQQAAYDIIKTSELDWCLVACPYIMDGPRRGTFRTLEIFDGGKKKIYPGDAAIAICNQINEYNGKKVIGIWY